MIRYWKARAETSELTKELGWHFALELAKSEERDKDQEIAKINCARLGATRLEELRNSMRDETASSITKEQELEMFEWTAARVDTLLEGAGETEMTGGALYYDDESIALDKVTQWLRQSGEVEVLDRDAGSFGILSDKPISTDDPLEEDGEYANDVNTKGKRSHDDCNDNTLSIRPESPRLTPTRVNKKLRR